MTPTPLEYQFDSHSKHNIHFSENKQTLLSRFQRLIGYPSATIDQ